MSEELAIRFFGSAAGVTAALCVGYLVPWVVATIRESASSAIRRRAIRRAKAEHAAGGTGRRHAKRSHGHAV